MAKPAGIHAKGGNKTLNPHARDEWMVAKKIARPKQVYIYDNGHSWSGLGQGHWEKI